MNSPSMSPILGSLPVNTDGAHLSYIDSGAPKGNEPYKTIIFIHGLGINACEVLPSLASRVLKIVYLLDIFEPLVPYALQCRIRLILVNRRAYGQSTPMNEAEVASIRSSNPTIEDFRGFLQDRAMELLRFIAALVKKEELETHSVCLLGWSAGCVNIFALLASLSELSITDLQLLEDYLRSVILYGEQVLHSLSLLKVLY